MIILGGGENVKERHCKVFWLSVLALFNDLSGFLLLVIIIIVSFSSFLDFALIRFVEIVKCLLVGVACCLNVVEQFWF